MKIIPCITCVLMLAVVLQFPAMAAENSAVELVDPNGKILGHDWPEDDLEVPSLDSTDETATVSTQHPAYKWALAPYSDENAKILELDEVLELALEHNFGIIRQEYSIKRGHYSIDKTYYAYDPTLRSTLSYNRSSNSGSSSTSISGSVGYTMPQEYGDAFQFGLDLNRSSGGSGGLPASGGGSGSTYGAGLSASYSRPLSQGAGRYINLINRYQSSNNLELAYDKLDDDVRKLKKSVLDIYFQVVAAREAIRVREANLEIALKQLERAIERYKVGLAIMLDVTQAETSVISQRSSLLDARRNYDDLLDSLTQLIGIPAEVKLRVDPDNSLFMIDGRLPDDDLWPLVEEYSYELKSLNTQLDNLELDRDRVLDQLKPDIDLSLDYTRGSSEDNFGEALTDFGSESYGVSVTWNTTPGKRASRADVEMMELELASLEVSIADARLALKTQLRQLQRDLDEKQRQIELAQANVDVAREALAIQTERQRVGLATTLDVVEANEDLLSAELALLNARVSYQQTYRELMLMAGLI